MTDMEDKDRTLLDKLEHSACYGKVILSSRPILRNNLDSIELALDKANKTLGETQAQVIENLLD